MKGYEILIAFGGAASGYILYWISKMLGDKKDMTVLTMKVEFLTEKIEDMKKELEHISVEIDYLKRDR